MRDDLHVVQALSKIQEASDSSATHNCWAFKVAGNARSTDDGEPSGTAGKPILGAIEGDGLDGVAVLVIRWVSSIYQSHRTCVACGSSQRSLQLAEAPSTSLIHTQESEA